MSNVFTCGYCVDQWNMDEIIKTGFRHLEIETASQVVAGLALHPSDEEWGKRVYAAWDDNKILRRAYQRDGQSDVSRKRAWAVVQKWTADLMRAGRGCPTCGFGHVDRATFDADRMVKRCGSAAGLAIRDGAVSLPKISVAKTRLLDSMIFSTLDGMSVVGRVEDTPYGRKNIGMLVSIFDRAGFDAPDSVRINKCGRNALIMTWV